MADTPQPGRIPPPQPTGKVSGALSSKSVQTAAKALGPEAVIATRIVGVTQRFAKARAQAPGKRMTALGKVLFISFAVIVDLVEIVLDIFVIGAIVNRIIDVVVAIIFFLFILFKGLTIEEDWKVYGSVAGTLVGEFMPGIDMAPFFTLDAWYITHSIERKDQTRQSAIDEQNNAADAEQERQEWIANYQQQQAMSAQEENEVAQEEEDQPVAPEQGTARQDEGGVGRINPPQFKTNAGARQSSAEQYRKAT